VWCVLIVAVGSWLFFGVSTGCYGCLKTYDVFDLIVKYFVIVK